MIANLKILIKNFFEILLDSCHFGKSSDSLRILEEATLKKREDLFSVPFNYVGLGHYKTISPSQVIGEIRQLFDLVCSIKPKVICEIGTDKGGTLYLWCLACKEDGLILSIDLPSRLRYSERRRRLYSQFKKSKNQELIFLPADSHESETEKKLRKILSRRSIDFLFIDGDHTYNGVKQDFRTYSKYVRIGGIIAFHDIRTIRQDCGVKKFWQEISANYDAKNCWEFTLKDFGPAGAGIGVIRVSNY